MYCTEVSLFVNIVTEHVDLSVPSWHEFWNYDAVGTRLLHLQPFMKIHYHFLIIMELLTSKCCFTAQINGLSCGVIVLYSNAACTHHMSDTCCRSCLVGSCWTIHHAVWTTIVTLGRLLIPQQWGNGNSCLWLVVKARMLFVMWPNFWTSAKMG